MPKKEEQRQQHTQKTKKNVGENTITRTNTKKHENNKTHTTYQTKTKNAKQRHNKTTNKYTNDK